jgi:hypothetical protein
VASVVGRMSGVVVVVDVDVDVDVDVVVVAAVAVAVCSSRHGGNYLESV